MMKQDCDEHSAEFWIVTIGMAGEVQERIGLNSLLLSDQYIKELAIMTSMSSPWHLGWEILPSTIM
jgi:hypothetical protein